MCEVGHSFLDVFNLFVSLGLLFHEYIFLAYKYSVIGSYELVQDLELFWIVGIHKEFLFLLMC